MRLFLLTLLVLSALLSNVDAALHSRIGTPDFPLLPHHQVSSRRLLRTGETLNDEERAMNIPGNSKFVKWLNSLNSKTSKLAKADKRQAKTWLGNKESLDDVFHRLELDTGVEKFMSNPNINAWAAYMKLYNIKYPDKKVSMIGMLTKTYGEAGVARTLQMKQPKFSQRLAGELRLEQLNGWKLEGKSVNDVFSILKLDKAGYDLFTSPQLNAWYIYTGMISKKDPEGAMISVLAASYGDDVLAKIFFKAQPKVSRMRFIALRLETAMGKGWLSKGLSPDKVFRLLKLDDGVNNLFHNSNLRAWLSYVEMFNMKKPDMETTIIKTLTTVYGYDAMSKMLEAAKKVPTTKLIATQWQMELIKLKLRSPKIIKTEV